MPGEDQWPQLTMRNGFSFLWNPKRICRRLAKLAKKMEGSVGYGGGYPKGRKDITEVG